MEMKWNQVAFIYLFVSLFALSGIPRVLATESLPDTGQTQCYNNTGPIACPLLGEPFYGQDAQFSRNRSYTKLDAAGNELTNDALEWFMVRDNVTGLIWEVKQAADGQPNYDNLHDADNTYTWYDSNPATNGGNAGTPGNGTDTEDFIAAINAAEYGKHNDWRLPTAKELALLIDRGSYEPAIDNTLFPATRPHDDYWSSTVDLSCNHEPWCVSPSVLCVDFDTGNFKSRQPSRNFYVRAVCAGQQVAALDHLNINANDPKDPRDDTVTDANNGLMWQRSAADSFMTWEAALEFCQQLNRTNFAGYSDWRLPDINELISLIDFTRSAPAIYANGDGSAIFFGEFPDSTGYWSSTTSSRSTGSAWLVYFDTGDVGIDMRDNKTNRDYGKGYVRAVRSIQSKPAVPSDPSVNYIYYLPYYFSTAVNWSGVGLRNCNSSSSANIDILVFDNSGSRMLSDSMLIPGRGQIAAAIGNGGGEGWMQVSSSQPLTGLCFFGTVGLGNYMADITLINTLSSTLYVPHVAQTADGWDTKIFVCNPNDTSTSVTLTMVNQLGKVTNINSYSIAANGSGQYTLPEFSGSVEVTSVQKVAAFALYTNLRGGGYCYAGISAVDPTDQNKVPTAGDNPF